MLLLMFLMELTTAAFLQVGLLCVVPFRARSLTATSGCRSSTAVAGPALAHLSCRLVHVCSGRLVTAMQLQTEAALMIANKRPSDALSVLELAVLFTLYPVHHDNEALAAWHQSLASNSTIFAA